MSERSSVSDPLWFKDAIIYELHIKAFQDSNHDGIGDFNGLISRLDYLQDLGVTAIWLLPFYPSPQRDGGYDISDYFSINPDYGTLRQFRKLLKKAHKRGLKIITELVLNHTSDQHPWFQRARKAAPGSPERDYYVWSDTTDAYRDARIIFQDFETSNWTWDPVAEAYYWHRFYSHQPDLNFANPEVQESVFQVLDFWIDMGVDGFRLDAIPYLFEREGTNCENLPETHAFLKKLRAHVEARNPEVMLLAEANMWPEDSVAYFGEGDECHMNYHFPLMPRMFMSLKMEDRYPITDIMEQTPSIPDNCQWALFLRNHDELTLEMVTDEERDYMHKAYGKSNLSRINLGLRHRLAPLLDNNRGKIELMNCLLFSLPGTPVIYYGDEIGMGDNVHLGDRDGVRTPMQWSPDRNAGFSQTNPQQLYLPLIADPEYRFETVNVEIQQRNTSSLLWWTKRMLDVRKRYQAFGRGDLHFLQPENAKVLAFLRTYEDETLLVVANLSRFSQAASLDLSAYAGREVREVFSRAYFPRIEDGLYPITLGPHDFMWFELKAQKTVYPVQTKLADLPISLSKLPDLIKPTAFRQLAQEALPAYLNRCTWFDPQNRILQDVALRQSRSLSHEGRKYLLLHLEVAFDRGMPDQYVLPLGLVPESAAAMDDSLRLARISFKEEPAILYDATYEDRFLSYVMRHYLQPAGKGFKGKKKKLSFRRLDHPGANSTWLVNDDYFLKYFHKIDTIPLPEVEMARYLQETEHSTCVPAYMGSLQLPADHRPGLQLGLLQARIHHQGHAAQYFADVAHRYLEAVLTSDAPEPEPVAGPAALLSDQPPVVDPELLHHIGDVVVSRTRDIGQLVGNLHLALAAHPERKGFQPEAYTLHYQRSLFAALQSLLRSASQQIRRQMDQYQPDLQAEAERFLDLRPELITYFRQLTEDKLKTQKLRIHGDLRLEKLLFTGKDFVIIDLGGNSMRPFTETRLRKSPLQDVVTLLHAFHYLAHFRLRVTGSFRQEDAPRLRYWAEHWYRSLSRELLDAYLQAVAPAGFLPEDRAELRLLFNILRSHYALERLSQPGKLNRSRVRTALRELLTLVDTPAKPG